MANFSPTDVALVGFGLARNRPKAVLAWALLNLVSALATIVVMVTLSGPAFMQMQEMTRGGTPDPQAMMQVYGRMLPGFLLVIPLSIIFSGILYAGASRLVLRPAESGFGWLRFGADEFRQMLLLVLIWLILGGAYIVVALTAGILAAVGSLGGAVLAGLLAVLGVLAGVGVMLFLAVRLSLASPITFANGKLGIGDSWRMTKGHFWNLLGAYLLSAVMAIIVGALAMAIFFGVGSLIFGLAETGSVMTSPDMSSLATVFKPVGIIYYVFSAGISALTSMIFLGPPPTIYKAMTGGDTGRVFD